MPSITATFKNDTSDSRAWVIVDVGIDPNAPKLLFQDYLEGGQSTPALSLYSDDGFYGRALYQRSDGPQTAVDVSNNDEVRMS